MVTEQLHQVVCRWEGGPEGRGEVAITRSGKRLSFGLGEQFGGRGIGEATPEEMLGMALSSCYVLTLDALAKLAKLEMSEVEVTVQSQVERDRVNRGYRITHIVRKARLTVPRKDQLELAEELLKKADFFCVISRAVRDGSELELKATVEVAS